MSSRLAVGRGVIPIARWSSTGNGIAIRRWRTACRLFRRHATVPQAWMQPENWEFETHRPTSAKVLCRWLIDGTRINGATW